MSDQRPNSIQTLAGDACDGLKEFYPELSGIEVRAAAVAHAEQSVTLAGSAQADYERVRDAIEQYVRHRGGFALHRLDGFWIFHEGRRNAPPHRRCIRRSEHALDKIFALHGNLANTDFFRPVHGVADGKSPAFPVVRGEPIEIVLFLVKFLSSRTCAPGILLLHAAPPTQSAPTTMRSWRNW